MVLVLQSNTPKVLEEHKYLYQGKEFQNELGLDTYDFEWRMYDPAIARTFQVDPHADSYFGLSPYSWVANNPLRFIDPDGRDFVPGGGAFGGDLYNGAEMEEFLRDLQMQFGNQQDDEDEKEKERKRKNEEALNARNGGVQQAGVIGIPLGPIAVPFLEGLGLAALGAEIDRLTTELNKGLANGVQYTLRTTKAGEYSNLEWGKKNPVGTVKLGAHEIWKIGETTRFDLRTGKQYRYSEQWLKANNLEFVWEFTGNQVQIYMMQQLKILQYSISNFNLPPGNKGVQ